MTDVDSGIDRASKPAEPDSDRWTEPWSERLCAAVCAAFALWTLACHAAVAAGASLIVASTLFAVLLAIFAWSWRRPAFDVSILRSEPETEETRLRQPPSIGRSSALALALALALAVALGLVTALGILAWRSGGGGTLLWLAGALVLVVASILALRAPADFRLAPPVEGRRSGAALWLTALACVVLALIAHRPDADDAFYVNVAVVAADSPSAPLYPGDTMHGIEGLPLHIPIYRLHAYELLNGAVSALTGWPAIHCFHWLSAALGALLLPLAHAALFRRLTPRIWPAAVLVLVVVLLAAGDAHRWYGNFALVRIWQGKSLMLFVATPLIYAWALRFAARPTRRHWLELALAQVAAVGLSSTAVWAAPAAAGLALLSTLGAGVRQLKIFLAGVLSSAYVLAAGLVMKPQMQSMESESAAKETGALLGDALHGVFGDGALLVCSLLAIFLAPFAVPAGPARRFASLVPAAAWLVLLNPYLETCVSAHVTGKSYWRALWSVPVPILLTLVLVAPLHLRRMPASWRSIACALLTALFVLLVPATPGLSVENGVRLAVPGLKVPPAYARAAELHETLPAGTRVAVPLDIGAWLPTFHHPVHPLVVRSYLRRQATTLGEQEIQSRALLTALLSHTDEPLAARHFREELERRPELEAVYLPRAPGSERFSAILEAGAFHLQRQGEDFEIWRRGAYDDSVR